MSPKEKAAPQRRPSVSKDFGQSEGLRQGHFEGAPRLRIVGIGLGQSAVCVEAVVEGLVDLGLETVDANIGAIEVFGNAERIGAGRIGGAFGIDEVLVAVIENADMSAEILVAKVRAYLDAVAGFRLE